MFWFFKPGIFCRKAKNAFDGIDDGTAVVVYDWDLQRHRDGYPPLSVWKMCPQDHGSHLNLCFHCCLVHWVQFRRFQQHRNLQFFNDVSSSEWWSFREFIFRCRVLKLVALLISFFHWVHLERFRENRSFQCWYYRQLSHLIGFL